MTTRNMDRRSSARGIWVIAASACLLLTAGCSDKAKPAPGGAASSATAASGGGKTPAAEAREVYDTRCATCHGKTGKGDGPGAAALNPKPASFADAEWQKKITDEQISKAIVEGGKAVGKSELMAPNPDLKAKPEVVKELVKKVRKLGGG